MFGHNSSNKFIVIAWDFYDLLNYMRMQKVPFVYTNNIKIVTKNYFIIKLISLFIGKLKKKTNNCNWWIV